MFSRREKRKRVTHKSFGLTHLPAVFSVKVGYCNYEKQIQSWPTRILKYNLTTAKNPFRVAQAVHP